jgi:hypothetical protein
MPDLLGRINSAAGKHISSPRRLAGHVFPLRKTEFSKSLTLFVHLILQRVSNIVKGQTGHRNTLTSQYLENPLFDRHQTSTLAHPKEQMTSVDFDVKMSMV